MAKRERDSKGRFKKGHRGGGGNAKKKHRRNPGNPPGTWRKRARRAYHTTRGFIGGMGLGEALKAMAQGTIGAGAGMLIRKKFGSVSNFSDNWEMKDYLMAGLGGVGAAIIAKHVFRASPATSRNIAVGGLLLVGIKLFQDELLQKSDTLKAWFGEESSEGSWAGLGAEDAGLLPGDVTMGDDGEPYVYGEDGQWRPADDSHRLMGNGEELSGLYAPSNLGEELSGLYRPGALGAVSEMGRKMTDAYSRA